MIQGERGIGAVIRRCAEGHDSGANAGSELLSAAARRVMIQGERGIGAVIRRCAAGHDSSRGSLSGSPSLPPLRCGSRFVQRVGVVACGDFRGRPTGRFTAGAAACGVFRGRPTGRFTAGVAACGAFRVLRGRPTPAVAGAAVEAGLGAGVDAMAARMVRSVASRRAARARTRRRAERVAESASASDVAPGCRFCFFPAMIGATLP